MNRMISHGISARTSARISAFISARTFELDRVRAIGAAVLHRPNRGRRSGRRRAGQSRTEMIFALALFAVAGVAAIVLYGPEIAGTAGVMLAFFRDVLTGAG